MKNEGDFVTFNRILQKKTPKKQKKFSLRKRRPTEASPMTEFTLPFTMK